MQFTFAMRCMQMVEAYLNGKVQLTKVNKISIVVHESSKQGLTKLTPQTVASSSFAAPITRTSTSSKVDLEVLLLYRILCNQDFVRPSILSTKVQESRLKITACGKPKSISSEGCWAPHPGGSRRNYPHRTLKTPLLMRMPVSQTRHDAFRSSQKLIPSQPHIMMT